MLNKFIKKIFFNRWAAFIHDVSWVPLVIFIAYLLRFNLDAIPGIFRSSMFILMAFAVPIQGIAFWFFGLYRGLWRYASPQDLMRVIKAVFLGTVAIIVVSAIMYRLHRVPRSVLLLYPLLLTTGLIAPRILYRWFKENKLKLRSKTGVRTLIVGAGTTGELLLRDLVNRGDYQPIALVDDDKNKQGRELHGVRVMGGISDIGAIISSLEIDIVLVAIPSADRLIIKRIMDQTNKVDVECKTVPSTMDLVNKSFDIDQLRPITVEDLLGRDPVRLDREAISGYLNNKVVLITGGGGSIGSELCRQVCMMKPEKLIIYEHSEFNLYSIEQELSDDFPELEIVPVLGDVKKEERVRWVFQEYTPEVVFHAAAYKHVPMLEFNPAEGVLNNVQGTKVIADAADRFKTERFVLVSTDKAVNPTNVMGASKRVSELYCQNLYVQSATKFITTRFGNVLGSAGSVVPLFERQIQKGGPVTVTHKEISRYFMTIPESVSLILQAGAMGSGGEIFVLDMGQPVLIKDLAEQMIRLSGLIPGQDIEIVYTGLRRGEKLHEELFHSSEPLEKTKHPKLMLADSRRCDWDWLNTTLDELYKAANSRDVAVITQVLQIVVPEYKPYRGVN